MFKSFRSKAGVILVPVAISLVLAGMPAASLAGEPKPPGPGEMLAGPPVVGRMELTNVRLIGDLEPRLLADVEFRGLCADTDGQGCQARCNARFSKENIDLGQIGDKNGDGKVSLDDLWPEDLIYQAIYFDQAKGCILKYEEESIRLVINTVISLDFVDLDSDGVYDEAFADIVLLFVAPVPLAGF